MAVKRHSLNNKTMKNQTIPTYRQSIQADLMNLLGGLNITHISWEDVDRFDNQSILDLIDTYTIRIKNQD